MKGGGRYQFDEGEGEGISLITKGKRYQSDEGKGEVSV